jgi:hypothetical protein
MRKTSDPLEVSRDRRGNETQRVSHQPAPRVSIRASTSAPRRCRASVAFASRAELLARRVSSTDDTTPFSGRFLACDAVSRFSGLPHVFVKEHTIWNKKFAWTYPAVRVDEWHELGIVLYEMGGGRFPWSDAFLRPVPASGPGSR